MRYFQHGLPYSLLLLCAAMLGPLTGRGDDTPAGPVAAASDEFSPPQDTLPTPPPQDAIVLLGGKQPPLLMSMAGGEIDWPIDEGVATSTRNGSRSNHVVSKLHFRDAEIHVEFLLPERSDGNSGVYIHGNYELQIFNSFGEQQPTQEDMGALYGFAPPLANAARQPGEWQVYDIRYRAPRRDAAGVIIEQGSITAWLNGRKVQDNTRFGEPRSNYHPYRHGATPYLAKIWERQKGAMTGPVFFQDHDSPVRFRNLWVRPLDDQAFLYAGE